MSEAQLVKSLSPRYWAGVRVSSNGLEQRDRRSQVTFHDLFIDGVAVKQFGFGYILCPDRDHQKSDQRKVKRSSRGILTSPRGEGSALRT